jgi:hypothetical protein
MAKKRQQSIEEQQRQSRKEILLARKHAQQTRQVRLAVIGIGALVGIVLLIGAVNELVIKPSLPVADVHGTEIVMREWQEQVRFRRAQLIVGIEGLADALGQDIGQVQQYAAQQINSLIFQPDTVGEEVLNEMVDDALIEQAAAERGITVTDDEVQSEIEHTFSYYGGGLPTPAPTSTPTVMPTPSLTPIPTQVITEVVPTSTPQPTATTGPTSTPRPTSTPISLDSFQQSFSDYMGQFHDLGVAESQFRGYVRTQLYRDRLTEALAAEQGVAEEAEQASFYYITAQSEDEAQQAQSDIAATDYLTTWNTIKSRPYDPESDSTLVASELLWRTRDDVASFFGDDVAASAFEGQIEQPSDTIVVPSDTEGDPDSYYIIMVSGREVRPLSQSAIDSAKQQLLQTWLDQQKAEGIQIFDRWQNAVPNRPLLDPRFAAQATPTPTFPVADVPTAAPTAEGGN